MRSLEEEDSFVNSYRKLLDYSIFNIQVIKKYNSFGSYDVS